jgi:tRNA A-37 threonylcarbamoyl transferase component Bud32
MEAVKTCQGILVKNHKGRRDIQRFEYSTGTDETVGLYLKRIWQQDKKDGLWSLLRHGKSWSVCRREWENSRILKTAGFQTADLVAFGEECGYLWEHFSFLLTRAVPVTQTVEDFIRDSHDRARRREVIQALAIEVRRLHAAGLAAPDLYCRHLFVELASQGPRFHWIDVSRLDRCRRVSLRRRARDLAALNITAPLRFASARERLLFLRTYAGRIDRRLFRKIESRMRHLLKRRKYKDFAGAG